LLIPLIAAALTLLAHLAGNPHYGFFRDELYFIACGLRPDWGYVDQPPLVPLLSAATQMFGPSLVALRAVAALLAAGSVYVTGRLAAELGGGRFAQALAAFAAFSCPVLMSFGTRLVPDSVGLLLWPLTAWCVLRVQRGGPKYLWLVAGGAIGVSFQAKYSIAFFAVALLVGMLATSSRRLLKSRWCLAGVGLALLIALPNIVWQVHHGLPMLELLRNGQNGKNAILGPGAFVLSQLLVTNPLLSAVWIAGLAWLLARRDLRFLGLTFLVLTAEMIVMHGKHYYAASVYPILFAAGGVATEAWTAARRTLRIVVVGTAVLSGFALVPYVMPVLPVETFLVYQKGIKAVLPLEATKTEKIATAELPQDWADMHGWPEIAAAVAKVYGSLPAGEREEAVIAASNYGEAAAIELFGKPYGLPPVISGHNQYFLWGTHGRGGTVLIDVGGDCGKGFGLYRDATLAATFTHPYVMPHENNLPIMVCRRRLRQLADIWPQVKRYW
jgi:4-amino-4-deoxy-L-arabinose transferase-like glycosyltransferase